MNSTLAGICQGICQKMWKSASKIQAWKPATLSKMNATFTGIFQGIFGNLKYCYINFWNTSKWLVLNTPKYLFNSVIFRIFPEGRSQNAFLIQLSLEYFQKAGFVLFNKYVFGKKYTRETIKLVCQTKSFSSGTVFCGLFFKSCFPC